MSNINISNLSFRYQDSSDNIFNNLNLDLDSSWKLGLVGRNGRGKTTFLNLLRGNLRGTGKIQAKLEFNYFPLTVKNSFPLIDEPTNHLDEDSRMQVIAYLQQHSNGYIVVSHDRAFLNQVTNHILAIENTEIHLYQGNFASYEDTKTKRDKFNQDKNEKLQGQIRSLNESRKRVKGYSLQSENNKKASAHKNEIHAFINKGFFSHKAAKIMKRSKNLERRMDKNIQDKKGLMTNIESISELEMNFHPN